MYAVNADGGGDGIIFGYRMGAQGATHIKHGVSRMAYAVLVDPLRDDPRHALIATYAVNGANVGNVRTMSAAGVFPDVERIDLVSGATTRVATSPLRNASFLTDHHGGVRFAYGVDADQSMKVWYRGGPDAEWALLLDEAREHQRMMPLAFNRKEDKVYFVVRRRARYRRRLPVGCCDAHVQHAVERNRLRCRESGALVRW